MIVSVRGTSGSGKSTLARELMATARGSGEPIFELGRSVGHQYSTFRTVGPYPEDVRLAAGVDILNHNMRRRDELFEQITTWAAIGGVFYEGLLVSSEVQRTVELAKRSPSVVIFLTTPLDVCLERIDARRQAKAQGSLFGEGVEPVNPKKTTERFYELQRVAYRLHAEGVQTYRLNCDAALRLCKELLL